MATVEDEQCDPSGLGLCGDCLHAHRITTDKGSVFLQCRLSFTDPRFKKYAALPVLTCSGYEKRSDVVSRK
jgi:hypothetical protein